MSNEIENQPEAVKDLKAYFKGVKSEWGKITWPMRQQVVAETIIVLIVVAFITSVVYLIDIGFRGLFKFLHLI